MHVIISEFTVLHMESFHYQMSTVSNANNSTTLCVPTLTFIMSAWFCWSYDAVLV